MVDISKLRESELPAEPSEFETLVRKHCGDAREAFQLRYGNSSVSTHPVLYANCFRWVQECGDIFRTHKSSWGYLVPTNPHQSAVLVEHFFNCACSLMSIQIREAVQNSLNDFVEFFQLYEEGNDYDGEYNDMRYIYQSVS